MAAITVIGGGALIGCSGTSPFATPFAAQPLDAFSTSGGFDDPNRQPYDQLAQAFPQHSLGGHGGTQMPQQTPSSSIAGGWLA